MTIKKNWKSISAAALALATISSVSLATLADDTSVIPMTKIATTDSMPATMITEMATSNADVVAMEKIVFAESIPATATTPALAADSISAEDKEGVGFVSSINSRTNEATGKTEISTDGGATWQVFDGKAIALTPAMPAENK